MQAYANQLSNYVYLRNTKRYLEVIERMRFTDRPFEFPVMKVYETFEEDKWIVGEREILAFLTQGRFMDLSHLRAESPWTIQGVEMVETEIQPILQYFFLYPKVS